MAMILSASMMLEWLGEKGHARTIEEAVTRVLEDGSVLTPDLRGSADTKDVTAAIEREI
jgi:isocitrate/isopropylmalate dehydrogenase